jgi:hypothetical protein
MKVATMHLKVLYADVQGYSLLDVGHFRIQSLHQSITAGTILSGYTLGNLEIFYELPASFTSDSSI